MFAQGSADDARCKADQQQDGESYNRKDYACRYSHTVNLIDIDAPFFGNADPCRDIPKVERQ